MDSGKEKDDSEKRKEDSGGGGEGVEPGGTWQGKPPDEATTNNPDESQRSLSEVTRCDIILKCNHHIEIFLSRVLMGPAW